MNLGTSHDTSEFAGDSMRYWWANYGSILYPLATSILILCDGGGSNSSRSYLFKEQLWREQVKFAEQKNYLTKELKWFLVN
jgi:hypothetical protein